MGFVLITANTVVNMIANANANDNNLNNNNNNNNNNNDNNNMNDNTGRSFVEDNEASKLFREKILENTIAVDPFSVRTIHQLISHEEESYPRLDNWLKAVWASKPRCLINILCQVGQGFIHGLKCQESVC